MNSLLISLPMQGFLWLLLLFVFCFLGVHILKFAQLGKATPPQKEPPPQAEKEEAKKTPAEKPQEPVYYIVERKTRRVKSTYGDPKEIRFK